MLVKHAKDGDALAPYAVAGLGWMRRVESAKHLAALLASTKDATLAATAAEALGTVGSSWAWRALGEKRAAEGLAVRKICAEALAPSFVRQKGDVRTRAAESLLMIEHPATVDLLRSARPAKGAAAKAVDHLIVRIQEQQQKRR